jgi:hypothetical protein
MTYSLNYTKPNHNKLIPTTMTQNNWIGAYSPAVKKFQEGGAMAAPEAAPMGPEAGAPPAGGGGGADLEAMLAEYAQTRDPQLAVAICDAIVEMMAQGGGAEGGAPAGPAGPEGAPMAKKGMKMKKGPIFKGGAKKAKC